VTRSLATLLAFLAVSAAFSWPTARFDPDVLVTRHFDLLPSVWLLDSAGGSAWPVGERLSRVEQIKRFTILDHDLTQKEIGTIYGLSQMQVSRILQTSLERVRILAGAA
jgi:hypothetical protein